PLAPEREIVRFSPVAGGTRGDEAGRAQRLALAPEVDVVAGGGRQDVTDRGQSAELHGSALIHGRGGGEPGEVPLVGIERRGERDELGEGAEVVDLRESRRREESRKHVALGVPASRPAQEQSVETPGKPGETAAERSLAVLVPAQITVLGQVE